MYRTWVILRHTFLDTVVQPIYTLLLGLGAAIIIIFALLPFFTLGEDTVMFKSVCLDVVLVITLIATLFMTSKAIYEEVEDRTMLNLMSKPVKRREVLIGKYLGIILSALVAIGVMGAILMVCTYWRIPADYQMRLNTLDDTERARIFDWRLMHLTGLALSLLLAWMQVSVLAAIGVALSTRFSLVVNLPAVILLYVAGNLTRFLQPIWGNIPGSALEGRSPIVKGIAQVISIILPYLGSFDLREATVTGQIAIPGTGFANYPQAIALSTLFGQISLAGVYALCYVTLALAMGLFLFHNRELGGAES